MHGIRLALKLHADSSSEEFANRLLKLEKVHIMTGPWDTSIFSCKGISGNEGELERAALCGISRTFGSKGVLEIVLRNGFVRLISRKTVRFLHCLLA